MNVRLTTGNSQKDTTVLVSEKLNRLIDKFFTADEMQTYEKLSKQQTDNLNVGIYWVLHNIFGFTAEQLTVFIKEFNENFEEIFTLPAYLLSDVPQKAELEESLGITVAELENT